MPILRKIYSIVRMKTECMPMQTAAVLSYVDPVSAIILSALLLSQPMTLLQIFGAVLILGSALANEVLLPRLGKNKN